MWTIITECYWCLVNDGCSEKADITLSVNKHNQTLRIFNKLWLEKYKNNRFFIIISIFLNFDGYQSHISEEVGSSRERYVIMFTPGGHGVNSRHIAVETILTLLWSDNIQHYFRQLLTRGENKMASHSHHAVTRRQTWLYCQRARGDNYD